MSQNQLSPANFCNLWWALYQSRYSGQLTFKNNAKQRKISLLDGVPVIYESARTANELESLIKKKQLVPAARLSWVASRIGPNEELVPALIEMGELSKSDVQKLEQLAQLDSIGQMLNWKRGSWKFERMQWLENVVSPALLSTTTGASGALTNGLRIDVVEACWIGVQELSQNELFEKLAPLMSVTLQWSEDTASGADALVKALPEVLEKWQLSWLSELLQLGTTLSDVGEVAAQQASGDELHKSFAAIWLLIKFGSFDHIEECRNPEPQTLLQFDGVGCVDIDPEVSTEKSRASRRQSRSERRSSEADQSAKAETREEQRERRRKRRKTRETSEQSQSSPSVAERIENFFAQRFDTSFYNFLRQDQGSTYRQLDQAALRLMKRWKGWLRNDSLDDALRRKLQQLFKGAKLVREVLTDPEKRNEYDNLLLAGAAPTVFQALSEQRREIRANRERPKVKRDQDQSDLIGEILASGDFQRALPLLQRARQEEPSNPDVLARLGWVFWKVESNFRKAEEFLSLSLTFDARHTQALEWYGRILIQTGNRDKAMRMATALKRIEATNIWASQLLAIGGDG